MCELVAICVIFREILDVCVCDLGLMLSCVSMVSSERFFVGFPPLPLHVRGFIIHSIDIRWRFPIEEKAQKMSSIAMKQRTKHLQCRPISINNTNKQWYGLVFQALALRGRGSF